MEAADLTLRLTKDSRSRAALLSCYAGILLDPMDSDEVALNLSADGRLFPITMRKSDIFTMAEVLHEEQYAITSPVGPEPVILDCGANIGLSAIWFLSRFPGARVHCFEPEPGNFRLLEANVGSHPGVVLNRAAVGRASGTLRLGLSKSAAMHSLVGSTDGESIEVDVVALPEYIRARGLSKIDVLKLDVEGSELDVIEGMHDSLQHVRLIVGELHESLVDETAFYRQLDRQGFRMVRQARTKQDGVHMFEVARN